MPNKRSIKRGVLRTKVRFGREEASTLGNTFNVSPRGIGVTTSRLYPKNAKLNLDIYLDNTPGSTGPQLIKTKGRVAWIKRGFPGQPSKMGIKLLEPKFDLLIRNK